VARWLAPGLAAVCFGALLVAIAWLAVEVPLGDDWDELAYLLKAQQQGHLAVDLLAPHNEHRMVLQRVLLLCGLRLFDGRLVPFQYLQALLSAGTFLLLWRQARFSQGLAGQAPWPWLPVPLALLVFLTPGQWEVRGFASDPSFAWALCGTAGLLFAASDEARRLPWVVACGLGATFTMASGLLFWPVAALALLVQPDSSRRARLAVAGLGGAIWIAFLATWQPAPGQPPLPGLPVAGLYWLAWIGAPLRSQDVASAAGVGSLGLLAVAVLVHRLRREPRAALLPWLALSVFTLLGGAASAVGRAGLGAGQALAPRYQGQAYLFWAALLALLVIDAGRVRRGWMALTATGVIVVAQAAAWPLALFHWRERSQDLEQARQELPDVCPGNLEFLRPLYPDPARLSALVEDLRASGVDWPWLAGDGARLVVGGPRPDPAAGRVEGVGWARVQGGGDAAACLAVGGRVFAATPGAELALVHQRRVLRRVPIDPQHLVREGRGFWWSFSVEVAAWRVPETPATLEVVRLAGGRPALLGSVSLAAP
jgi:hypothetical protein